MVIKPRRLLLLCIDFVFILASCAFVLRTLPFSAWLWSTITVEVCVLGSRILVGTYRHMWRYANTSEYLYMVLADFVGGMVFFLAERYLINPHVIFTNCVATVTLVSLASLGARFVYQELRMWKIGSPVEELSENKICVGIIGAGQLGAMLANELERNPDSRYEAYCFFDKDVRKVGSYIGKLRVYGENENVCETIRSMPIQELVIAIPNLSPERTREMYQRYESTGCRVRLYDFPLEGDRQEENKRTIRDINIEDLLFRKAVTFESKHLESSFAGKTVLITGGGGSIGSELCRQIAALNPGRLVVFDIYENNAYDIQQELVRQYGAALNLSVEIGSVRDAEKVRRVFDMYRPHVVFHAAAHKHVPLMEHNCDEAVKNNVFGTLNVANAAEEFGAERFVLISTDKAVNPTNIMGASKRLCEMIVQSKSGSKTVFTAVRFGNVLGSNGSVIPLFRRQIQSGGPVTITDKRVIRYFMTVPEAAQLVICAGAMARKNELYVLDMGKPVRILELAENMIRLAGYIPYKDIEIREIGLRPGEKLYEELLIRTEELDKTDNALIFIERSKPISAEILQEKLSSIRAAVESGSTDRVREVMMQIVPTYHSAEEVNRNAEATEEMRAAQ